MNNGPRAGIVDLVTSAEPAIHAPWWQQWPVVVGVLVLATLAVAIAVMRRINARHPAEVAFRKLSRKLGMSRRQREMLREAAAQRKLPPVALLLSSEGRQGREERQRPRNASPAL